LLQLPLDGASIAVKSNPFRVECLSAASVFPSFDERADDDSRAREMQREGGFIFGLEDDNTEVNNLIVSKDGTREMDRYPVPPGRLHFVV
jgi:hypothetical protein